MDVENYMVFVIAVACQIVRNVQTEGYCKFPKFLLPIEGNKKVWIGKTEYRGSNMYFDVQEEITVKETEIQIRVKSRSSCRRSKRYHSALTCYDHNIIHTIICIAEEKHGKFRVHIKSNGEERFSCLKFLQRNENVVQVFKADPSLVNRDTLCHDEYLKREDWPWLSKNMHGWKFCPNIGGYDFRATDSNTGKKVCERDMIPSRLESECVVGDGMVFSFTKPRCGPFQELRKDFQMRCWGHWIEDEHMYVLFGEQSRTLPRYSLRMPKEAEYYGRDEFTAKLYLNAIAPINGTNTLHWTLNLLRSAPGICYDESDVCTNAKSECTKHGQYEYAKICRKSCGLCDLAPTDRYECHFPTELQGNWVLFTEKGRQMIDITEGKLVFSNFGEYNCKSMHWENDYYKVISTYTNGCRPRYTCIKIAKGTGDTLAVQFSRSSLNDKSFELCQFQDDILPLGNYIHSRIPKQLIPMKSLFSTSCNLDGYVNIQSTQLDNTICDGRMSDVSAYTCKPLSKLTVRLLAPCTDPSSYEYECIASGQLGQNSKYLVTEFVKEDETSFICWKIEGGTDIATTYTRITCDTTVNYTNKTLSYRPPTAEHKKGIASITLGNDFESPCVSVQDQEHKPINTQKYDDRDSSVQKVNNRSNSVKIENTGKFPSEKYIVSSTIFDGPQNDLEQVQEAKIISNSANSAIHKCNIISFNWLYYVNICFLSICNIYILQMILLS